jgi:hypothetical protein
MTGEAKQVHQPWKLTSTEFTSERKGITSSPVEADKLVDPREP